MEPRAEDGGHWITHPRLAYSVAATQLGLVSFARYAALDLLMIKTGESHYPREIDDTFIAVKGFDESLLGWCEIFFI